MTRDEIIQMAREVGIVTHNGPDSYSMPIIERFAALVSERARTEEREACCGPEIVNAAGISGGDAPHVVVQKYRAAIRARG